MKMKIHLNTEFFPNQKGETGLFKYVDSTETS